MVLASAWQRVFVGTFDGRVKFRRGVANVEGGAPCGVAVAGSVAAAMGSMAVLARGGEEEIWDVAGPGREVGVSWFGTGVGLCDDVAGENWERSA